MRRLSSVLLAAALVFAFAPAALAAAPANDERSGATAITTLPYTVTNFDTTEATYNVTDPLCWTLESWVNTVWYSYTATATGRIMVDQAATVDHNPFIRVWDTADESTVLSCYDLNSPAYVEAVAGHTYMIMFADADASDGSGGMLSFTVSTNALPVELVVDVAVTRAFLDSGNLRVNGTWTKVTGGAIDVTSSSVFAYAAQQVKVKGKTGQLVSGEGPGVISSDGTWTASIPASAGTWTAMRTSLDLTFCFTDGADTDEPVLGVMVNVRRK
jgi:hypothetical protein